VLYNGHMTITTKDMRIAASHEVRLDVAHAAVEVVARPLPHWVVAGRKWLMNQVTDGIVWIAVLSSASGLGLLLSAIVDTVRYGHP